MSPQLSPVFLHCVICSTVPFLFLRLTQHIPTLSSLCSGTIFLWMYWPSFNAALVAPDYVAQHRSVINTYFSLAAACVTTFALSPVLKKGWKLDMVSALSTIFHLSSSLFVFSSSLFCLLCRSSLFVFSSLLSSCQILSSNLIHLNSPQVHIQNATLAGGVAVGTASNMVIQPWGALLIGSCAGALSTVGYVFLTVRTERARNAKYILYSPAIFFAQQ